MALNLKKSLIHSFGGNRRFMEFKNLFAII